MIGRRDRRRERTGIAAGVAGTIVVHFATVLVLWGTAQPADAGPPVYAVELVAAPAPPPETRPAPEATPRPSPQPAAPRKPDPTPPKPTPVAPKPPPSQASAPTEPPPRAAPPVQSAPGETPSTGSDAVTVSTPGLAFPYPDYLRNIVEAVYRRWQRPLANAALRAEVSFLILRDGSVREIRLTRPSGSFSFDLSAQGAIEAAGAAGAFGELPDGYPADVLPVSFYFTPRTK